MMKRNSKILFIIFSVLIVTACSGSKTIKLGSSIIFGSWRGVKLGNIVMQLGLSLPSVYKFQKTGKVNFLLTIAGKRQKIKGTFKILRNKRPFWITIWRNDGRIFHGIIEFINHKKIRMVLYDKRILPRATEFNEDDVQVFVREN